MSPSLDIASQLQVQRLRQDLASAQKKLDEYEKLVALLYDALHNIQANTCKKCKVNFEKFAPADLATLLPVALFPTSGLAQPPLVSTSGSGGSVPLWRRILSGHRPHPHLLNPGRPSDRASPLNPAALAAARSQSSLVTVSALARSRQTTSIASKPSHTSTSAQQTILSKGKLADWSITFNTKTKRLLDVILVDRLVFEEDVLCVRFSPDGNYLAIGLLTGKTHIYNVKSNAMVGVLAELSTTNVPPQRDDTWSMSFSPDGKYLATGKQSGIIQVWHVAKKHVRNVFRLHGRVSGVDFSPDGRFLVSCSHDRKVCIWSMRDGSSRVFLDTQSSYYSLGLNPDGRYIAATDYTGMLRVWNFRTGQQVRWAHTSQHSPATVAFLPDGKGLVTGGPDMALKCWDLSLLEEAQEGTVRQKETLTFRGHTDFIRGVAVSADGHWMISFSSDLTIRIWDSRTTIEQCKLEGHKRDIWWVGFCPAGFYFASGGRDGRVGIWKYETI